MRLSSVFILCGVLFLGLFYAAYQFIKQNKNWNLKNSTALKSLVLLLFFGFLLRIIIAPLIEGYPTDIACFKGWAVAAADRGLSSFYNADMFIDYPPGYIYVLYLVGFAKKIFSLTYDSTAFLILLKLPAFIADILSSILIFRLARKTGTVVSLTLVAMYLFNPAVIFNSAVYGQVDSFLTLFILLMLVFVRNNKLTAAAAIFVVALLIKPQVLIFAPLGVFALIQKVIERKNLKPLLLPFLSAIAAFIIIILPFSLHQNPQWLLKLNWKLFASYPYASANAFNLFALFGGNGALDSNTFFIFSYKVWAMAFLAAGTIYCTCLYFLSRHESKTFFISVLLIAIFFVLSVRVHERYIFPILSLLILSFIYTGDKRVLFLFAGFTITAFFNQALLIDSVLTKKIFWFRHDDLIMRLFSVANIILLACAVKLSIDIYIREKIIAMPAPASGRKTPDAAEIKLLPAEEIEKPLLSKKDFLILGILTSVYAAVALYNLGSFKAPQTCWKPAAAGESCYADIGSVKPIERICYYFSLGQGSFNIDFSDDAQNWGNRRIIEQKSVYETIGWRFIPLKLSARYIRITSASPGVMLNEIAIYTPGDKTPVSIKSITKGFPSSHSSPENVFDEQDTAVYSPGFLNSMYFDEVYHARSAYEYLHNIEPTETTHPPLGKLIIALGIAAFKMTPFGWRIMPAIFGIAMVPAVYCFGKRLFKSVLYAFVAAFLFACDFMHFIYTRIGTVDVFAVFFIIMMYYFMYRYFSLNFFTKKLSKIFLPLLLSGVFFGLAASVKWYALFGALGLAVIFFTSLIQRFLEYRLAKKLLADNSRQAGTLHSQSRIIVNLFPRRIFLLLLWCVFAFILVPCTVYLLSYIPFMMLPGNGHSISDVLMSQKYMFDYHSQLRAEHPFSSTWWQWPIIKRPLWLYMGQNLPSNTISSIVAMGNPAVWWLAIPATIFALFLLLYTRKSQLFIILAAFAFLWLPWAKSSRQLLFIYHFFAAVPFMILCLTCVFKIISDKLPKFKYAVFGYLLLVLFLFIMFYPILTGAVVSKSFVATYLRWFDSWIFYR